jgi:hypothetical protein
MTRMLHRWPLIAALALSLVGCINGLDEPMLVKTPRIFAMVADHPEIHPGQDVHVRVLAHDPMHRPLHYAFRACVDTTNFLGGGGSNGSGGVAPTMPLCFPMAATGETGTLPGALTQQVDTLIDMLPSDQQMFIRNVLATAGLPLTVYVDVSAADPTTGMDTILVSGAKIVGVTTRAALTTNPPYVYFRITAQPTAQDPTADPVITTYLGGFDPVNPFECIPWPPTTHTTALALASQMHAVVDPEHADLCPRHSQCPNQLTLSPADDPTTWEESFPIYDFSGGVRTGYEGSYYSWYSTASMPDQHGVIHSSLHTGTTQGPSHGAPPSAIDDTIRDNNLDVPRDPGTYDLWVVVRDGHLGESACHLTFEVTAPP